MSSESARAGKVIILEIDLSSGKVEKQDLGTSLREKYLGSRGVNSRILYDNVGPKTDALSPNNILIFGTGSFGATGVPSSSRLSITSKSPYCNFGYSDVGGFFAPEMRKAGYDHIVVRGKAEKPVFVWIDNDKVEVRSAAHLWGKGVFETNRLIKEELGSDVQVAAIGQAGEKLVNIANIMTAPNRAGGGKMGAVMGSKNLKAIAVRGSGVIPVANKELVRELSRKWIKRIKESPLYEVRCTLGGGHSTEMMVQIGAAPIKNCSTAIWPEVVGIGAAAISSYYTGKTAGCPGCPLQHHMSWEIKEGPYAGEKGVGLEGGPIMLYGTQVGVDYAPAVYKATNISNDYGIDAVEASCAIALVMDLFEHGIITKDDLDGRELKFGDYEGMMELIHKIARREGVGDVLGLGAVEAAERIGRGAKEYITYAKGRTSGLLDYRVLKGGYLNEMTSSQACEMMDGWSGGEECMATLNMATPEFSATVLERHGSLDPMDQLSYNKARSVMYSQDFMMVIDSMELCVFVTDWAFSALTLKDVAEMFPAVTGLEMGEKEIIRAAWRIRDLERAFWVRSGITRKDDYLKGRLSWEPVQDGPFKGEKMDPAKIDKMMDELYTLRGWDIKTGIPTKKRLLEDGLADVVVDLETIGKL